MSIFIMDKERGRGTERQILLISRFMLGLPVIMILMDQVGYLLLCKPETAM
jgi:hypothetical protein